VTVSLSSVRAKVYDWQAPLAVAAVAVAIFLFRDQAVWVGAWIASRFGPFCHNLISLPPVAHFPGFTYMRKDWKPPSYELGDETAMTQLFADHLRLTAKGVGLAACVALPVGVLIHRVRALYLPVFGLLDVVYAIPSLAVFPILLRYTGITDTTVLIALVAYCQFILVRNVVAGLDSVPAEAKEAARGMGMSRLQILARIELPLAMPVVVAGLRIAIVASIGIAAIAAFVAIPDLGTLFYDAVQNGGVNSYPESEAGAVAVIVLVLMADVLLRIIERLLPANWAARKRRRRA
jgi:osmoprotectant transport system permease protein